jgi:hypothetical protein
MAVRGTFLKVEMKRFSDATRKLVSFKLNSEYTITNVLCGLVGTYRHERLPW